nr:MAG TPA: hypothetical protein [Caudoviricetes sp.]
MQNDTKIYVSKKAALIVESIRDHSKEGNGSQKYNGRARKFTVEFIDGTTYESNNSLHVQNHIKDKYDEDGEAMLKREAEAAIAARAAAVTAEAAKKNGVDKVKYSESNTKKNADEKAARQRELKRERYRRYRQRNLEAVRQRDREYRRKKRAEEKASK